MPSELMHHIRSQLSNSKYIHSLPQPKSTVSNSVDVLTIREKIFAIEAEMKKFPQVECPLRHYFIPGMYAREVTIPEGALVTGLIYKYPQICTLSKGHMRVLIGDEIADIKAPYTVVSDRGIKRIATAVTECVWTTYVHTHETEIDVIEKQFYAYSEQEYQDFLKCQQ